MCVCVCVSGWGGGGLCYAANKIITNLSANQRHMVLIKTILLTRPADLHKPQPEETRAHAIVCTYVCVCVCVCVHALMRTRSLKSVSLLSGMWGRACLELPLI